MEDILFNFQSHYKATAPRLYGSVIRIDIIDQWNQIVILEINPYIFIDHFSPVLLRYN